MKPLTPAEAQEAYDNAEPAPLSEERIQEIVRYATQRIPTMKQRPNEEPNMNADKLVDIFFLLSSRLRLKIIIALIESETTVAKLAEQAGTTQPAISAQLRFFVLKGLVKSRREGKTLIYSLGNEHLRELLTIADKVII